MFSIRPLVLTLSLIILVPLSAFGGEWSDEHIAQMDVKLYVPDTTATGGKRALMISLHGCSQQAGDFQRGSNWEPSADEYGMVVAIPAVPNGGVYAGCWDYYDDNHSRSVRHEAYLINLATELLHSPDLAIDPKQVYISGLSSGGSEAMVMGCIAPDIFAGIGIDAGPAIGTGAMQIGSAVTDPASVEQLCRKFAGSVASSLSTQLTSVVFGSMDFIVAHDYSYINAEAMSDLYGARKADGDQGADEADSSIWKDHSGERVSLIEVNGMSHAWPAGGGPGGMYIDNQHLNYPRFLTQFLFANNRRISHEQVPEISLNLTTEGRRLIVSGLAASLGIASSSIDLLLSRLEPKQQIGTWKIRLENNGDYKWTSSDLSSGQYQVTVVALDGKGHRIAEVSKTQWIGEERPSVVGIRGTLDEHIAAGRLTYAEYGVYYLKYRRDAFMLYQQPDGRWSDVHPVNGMATGETAVATLDQHIAAGRLTYNEYAVYYLRYAGKPFALYKHGDGKWSDVANMY